VGTASSPPCSSVLAASIFLDVLNVFLLLLNLFNRD
jgi:FtsH-binding integral membrane protein